jgi:hypothetical protein
LEKAGHLEAARTARELERSLPKEMSLLTAATSIAQCLEPKLMGASVQRERLKARAVELLDGAARAGSLRARDLEAKEFDALRESEAFQRLLKEVNSGGGS